MDEMLSTTAETVGITAGGFFGLDMETSYIIGAVFIVLHLLTHEVPILAICVIGFLRSRRKRETNER